MPDTLPKPVLIEFTRNVNAFGALDSAFFTDGSDEVHVVTASYLGKQVEVFRRGLLRAWSTRGLVTTGKELVEAGIIGDRGLRNAVESGDLIIENRPWFAVVHDGEVIANTADLHGAIDCAIARLS